MDRMLAVLAVCSVFALANCGGSDDESGGNASCRSTLQRYLDCGVFDGEFLDTCHSQPETDFARCVSDCVGDASCDEIEDYICNADPNGCLEDCEDGDFECDNGREVSLQVQCDGRDDCFDFSDEEDCEVTKFRCGEFPIEIIDGGLTCNEECDCADCSDEDECGQFACGN